VSLRVLLDATAIPADRGGVGRYVDGLVAGLGTVDVELTVVCQRRDVDTFVSLAARATVLPAPAGSASRPRRFAWEQYGLPAVARRIKADVLHSPHYTMPLWPGVPVVVTLHDATFFSQPELHTATKARFFRASTRLALRRAARCVVPSMATREELVRLVGATASKLDVAYHGVDPDQFHLPTQRDVRRVRTALGIGDRPYVAFLGTIEPRKNVANLVQAFSQFVAGREEKPVLVLAGAQGWDTNVEQVIDSLPRGVDVRRPGYVPFEDLAGFLGGAELVAYPSVGEGFGLPVLEAMACGGTVLTTRRLSLPEVGGDAVAYCDTDPKSIANAISALLDDDVERARLSKAAVDRAASFTWQASARAHLAAYELAVAR
jgi:glycosyltransferase involved in cell wall biosynthesis